MKVTIQFDNGKKLEFVSLLPDSETMGCKHEINFSHPDDETYFHLKHRRENEENGIYQVTVGEWT